MRICRYSKAGSIGVGFYGEDGILPVRDAAEKHPAAGVASFDSDDLLDYLPHGRHAYATRELFRWVQDNSAVLSSSWIGLHDVAIELPIPRPNKLLLLAGNYAAHVEEGGEMAVERAETFPYVFMKPPTTTLVASGTTLKLPTVSPATIDHELELAVIIGKKAKGVPAAAALAHVAGYTIINDISDRKFRPNPNRRERPRDKFFDWLHGKWHDGCCPCGPCVVAADAIDDPQRLALKLTVNGEVRQAASTSLQVFSVAAVIEFISSFVTLEPGDIISTGTPAGVGGPKGVFLQPGDQIEASIERIGTLSTSVVGADE